jgi:hypothetical protein
MFYSLESIGYLTDGPQLGKFGTPRMLAATLKSCSKPDPRATNSGSLFAVD